MKIRLLVLTLLFCQIASAQKDFDYYFRLGQENYEMNRYNEAIDDFSMAIKNKNTAKNDYYVANVYMRRAYSKMHLKKFSLAINDITDALKIKPEYSELYLAGSTIHYNNKQYQKSIQLADEGLLIKPTYEDLIMIKIQAKCGQRVYQEAMSDIDTLLTNLNPRNIDALNFKAFIYRKRKEYQKCMEVYSKVIDLDAQNTIAFFDRGICRALMKDFEGALSDIQRGMSLDTNANFIGYNNIAYFIKFDQKDYKGAISLLDEAIRQKPDFAYGYCNRGYAKLQLRDLEGARADINKSISIEPENSYVYKVNAQWYIAEGKIKQACDNLIKANTLGYTEEYDEEVNELLLQHCK